MMFQGSDNIGKTEHFKYIQEVGGNLNGSTTQDRTNYYETVSSNNLELILWLESDRMQSLKINNENFNNQREVVKEELRERYENRPYGKWFFHIFENAYRNTPYEWIPIGDIEHLNHSSLEDAKKFYNQYYRPNNAVLVLSGDFEIDKAQHLIEKYFGELKPTGIQKNHSDYYKHLNSEIRLAITDNIKLPALYIAYKIPGLTSSDMYPLILLECILSRGKSSRLYKNLVYTTRIAKSVLSLVLCLESGGLFILDIKGFKDSNPDLLLSQIDKEIYNLFLTPVTEEELQKAKNTIETYIQKGKLTNSDIAEQLAYYWTFHNNTNMINEQLNIYSNVSLSEINEVIRKYLTKNNRVVLNYLPK